MKKVIVSWRDISGLSESGWKSKEDILTEAERKFNIEYQSIGWLLEENERYIVLVATTGDQEEYHDASMIMKSVITKIKTLTK
jgi:hypothetical protein